MAIGAFFRRSGKVIVLVTAREILDEQNARKLALVCGNQRWLPSVAWSVCPEGASVNPAKGVALVTGWANAWAFGPSC